MPEPLAEYRPFLDVVERHGALRIGVHEQLVMQRIVAAAQAGQWTRDELGDALASALATNAEQWQDLRRFYERHAPQAALSLPKGPTAKSRLTLLRLRVAGLRKLARRGGRGLLRRGVPLLLVVAAYLIGEQLLHRRHPAPAPQELCIPRVPEPPRPDSRYRKRPLPLDPKARVTTIQQVRPKLLAPSPRDWLGLGAATGGLCLFGVLLLRLWPHFRRRIEALLAAARAAAEQRHQREEMQRQQGQQARALLEQAAFAAGQNIRPHYRLELGPPVRAEIVEDTATLLGRVYQMARGYKVDVQKTLRATLRAGGQPRLALLPRRRAAELLVLYDEWDTQPYLPAFLKLLDRWQRLGVNLSRWRFEQHPAQLRPADGGKRLDLEELLHRHDGAPVVIFASRLHTQGLDAYQDWPRLLRQVELRAWLDPDPRPAEQRELEERQDIERLTPLLPRFGLTPTGLKALGRFLQQQGRGVALPPWEPLEVTAETELAIAKWMAMGSQVPDSSYAQYEAVRQRLFAGELTDARVMRLLIERLTAELGDGYRPHMPNVELDPEQQVKHQRWLLEEAPELFDAGFALLDETLGDTPPGMESGKPTLLTWEWLRRKRGYQAGRATDATRREQILATLDGTPAHESAALLRQQLQAVHAQPGQLSPATTPPIWLDWPAAQVGRYLGGSLWWAVAAVVLAVGVVLGAGRSAWVAARLPTRPVKTTIERLPDYEIEKIKSFGETKYRPALLPIPAGKFVMGSPVDEPDREEEEVQHEVALTHPFLMMETEVTQGQYKTLMGEDPPRTRKALYGALDLGTCRGAVESVDRPVYCVDWYDAVQYANQLSEREGLDKCYLIDGPKVDWPKQQQCKGYRLPTEAEWEYAARGGEQWRYAGSDKVAEVAWYDENAKSQAQPVQEPSKKANAWGLRGMSGNVWEWVWDWYAPYKHADKLDPGGPLGGSLRGVRGGSWVSDARTVRVAFRYRYAPGDRYRSLGFRLARFYP